MAASISYVALVYNLHHTITLKVLLFAIHEEWVLLVNQVGQILNLIFVSHLLTRRNHSNQSHVLGSATPAGHFPRSQSCPKQQVDEQISSKKSHLRNSSGLSCRWRHHVRQLEQKL